MPPTNTAKDLRVGIIGGSIAGCAAAIELSRVGCQVTVFERSPQSLQDRGAGIAMPLSLLETLQARDLFDQEMPHLTIHQASFVTRDEGNQEEGRSGKTLWERPFAAAVTNWGLWFRQLRKRVPDEQYHQGQEVTELRETEEDTVVLKLADGQNFTFDVVLWADGHQSLGRRSLFPQLQLQYSGYVAWRGMLKEKHVSDPQPFEEKVTYGMYEFGHAVQYIVPSLDDHLKKGNRRLNWLIYEIIAEDTLPQMMTDRQGRVQTTSLPPGSLSDSQIDHLLSLARTHLPPYMADVVEATTDPFIQSILDVSIPHYRQGRIGLIGDAASVTRPHTGSGAVKAMEDAISSATALTTHDTVEDALHAWDVQQSAAGEKLVNLGRAMGTAMVKNRHDWGQMTATNMEQWWNATMTGKNWYTTDETQS